MNISSAIALMQENRSAIFDAEYFDDLAKETQYFTVLPAESFNPHKCGSKLK
jgi:hypothetical protein